jgi:hypothetical protein
MNYSYHKFKKEDSNDVFKIFLKFQEQTKIETFSNLTNGQSPGFTEIYLREELRKMIRNNKTYVGTCDGEIFGFACFTESKIRKDALDLLIVCKKPNKRFNLKMKYLLLDVFKEAKRESNKSLILASLGPRSKFNSYKNFVIRVFKPKIIRKNELKRTIIQFND